MEFITPELMLLTGVLAALGYFFKQAKFCKDEYIPFVLILLGIVAVVFKLGFSVDSVLLGTMCASVAVTGKNIEKQTKKIKAKRKRP